MLAIWYVALRMTVQSWEEEEQLVLQWLIINNGLQIHDSLDYPARSRCFRRLNHLPLLRAVDGLCTCSSIQSEKLTSLVKNLVDNKTSKGKLYLLVLLYTPTKAPSIVSSLYSKKYLHMFCLGISMATIFALIMYGCAYSISVAAKNSRITPTIKATKGEITKCIDDFRERKINVMVATSVIEEGFDVPAINVVVSYDHLKDTVELCQCFGRARQKTSSLALMSERKDRPLAALKDVQRRQESIINE
ncbi:hypothetical protein ACHAXA_003654 [Cyclostephanos tholiformis]|uniref:Helicase C-terminal domain-containing protein n=1 Tax=Cyclostephanos tholiformis TaxID=382380 RepID=A0ABD3SPN9_9STRA